MKRYIIVSLLGILTGCLLIKYVSLNTPHEDSQLKQAIIKSEINHQNLNINKLIDKLSTNTEIILLEESGSSEISYTRSSNSIFKWCSQSDITLYANYNLILSIPTNSINITKQNNEVLVTFSERDFKIKSLELSNKTITRNKDMFGKKYNDDEVIVLEAMLKDKIKSNFMTQEVYDVASESLRVYLVNLADDLDIKIKF